MKLFTHLSTLCLVLCAALTAWGAEREETLRAINWVENPTNHTRRGSKGELGPYQFRAQTWRMHTNKPFSLAVVREHADEVAIKHYDWIKRGLEESGIDPSPFNIALAWNSGLGAVTRGRVPTVTYNYAERVHNLVEAQRAQRQLAHADVARRDVPVPDVDVSPAKDQLFSLGARAEQSGLHFSLNAAPVQFSVAASVPKFNLDPHPADLEVPTVFTRAVDAPPATAVAIGLEAPTFALPVATAPRFTLFQ